MMVRVFSMVFCRLCGGEAGQWWSTVEQGSLVEKGLA